MKPSLTLAGGDRMPIIGLGLWKVARSAAAAVVQQAIRTGYRHLDSACDYGNEAEVGTGIRAALTAGDCRREDLWVTSKLWNTYHARDHVRRAVERSLRDLAIDYLDLYLIHFPIAQEFVPFDVRYPPAWFHDPQAPEPRVQFAKVPLSETWTALEELVTAGLAAQYRCLQLQLQRCCGISWPTQRFLPRCFRSNCTHTRRARKTVPLRCENGIAVTGFSPLGALSYLELGMAGPEHSVLAETAVREAAGRHGKTPAQIVLRWASAAAVRPSSPRPCARNDSVENLTLFDFELSADEMSAIGRPEPQPSLQRPGRLL